MFWPSFRAGLGKLRLGLLQQFMVAAGLTIALSMAALAYSMSKRIEGSLMQSAAGEAALLIDAFLGPSVQELATSDRLSPDNVKKLDEILEGQLKARVKNIKIWLRDGTLVYSTDKKLIGKKYPSKHLDLAFFGKISGSFDELDDEENNNERLLNIPLIEIYAPLRRTGSRDIIAVGELYNSGEQFAAELRSIQFASAGIVGMISLPMMLLLFLMVRQASQKVEKHRERLTQKVSETEALAIQNDQLRRVAEESRIDSARSNELLLEQIGQDLHDGPVQLLSLLILKLSEAETLMANSISEGTNVKADARQLTTRILSELREISKGLVLPQLEGLSAAETIWLPVRAHEHVTGTKVTCTIGALPEEISPPTKVCIYRIVQEGLNNAFSHAGGRDQHVGAWSDADFIHVVVSDGGPDTGTLPPDPRIRTGLGLPGLKRRVEAFRGTFTIKALPEGGTRIEAKLPHTAFSQINKDA
jgi:signal transduction histidine kinase